MSKFAKKKIFLIYQKTGTVLFPPIDLLYLASIAENCGFEVKIFDCDLGRNFISELDVFRPDFIVAKITISNFKSDMELLALAKSRIQNLSVIVFGDPFLTYNTNVIYENPFIDYVIMGEPEFSLKDILNGLPNEDILGICYAENHQGVNVKGLRNEMRSLNPILDILPFPARYLINNNVYKNIFSGKSQMSIQVSRGRAEHCFYDLESSVLGIGLRFRSVESVLLEIKECIEKYKINDFYFMSENFSFNKKWVNDLCQKIIESGLKINWMVKLQVKGLDEKTIELMYKAGCRFVDLSVINGNQEILNNLDCKITLDDVRNIVKTLKKKKIKIKNSFIVGLPWETEKTFEDTINFAIELNSDFASFDFPTPLPGTPFFAYVMLNKFVEDDLKFENAGVLPIVRSHELSKERIQELQKEAIVRFNNSKKYWWKSFEWMKK